MDTPPPLPDSVRPAPKASFGTGKILLIIGACFAVLALLGLAVATIGLAADAGSTLSPDRIAKVLAERGYPTKYVDRQFEVDGMGRIAVKELRVYNRGVTPGLFTATERIGGVFYVSSDYTDAQAALIAAAGGARPQRLSGVIYFRPYRDDQPDDLPVEQWLRSFN
jgi:hypothetical protein